MRLPSWLTAPSSSVPEVRDPAARRLIALEMAVMLTVTLGLSALRSALSLLDSLLAPTPIADQQVALNAPAAQADLVDLALQLVRSLQLFGWGALGAYLLLRAGFSLRRLGLDGTRKGRDVRDAAGLAALIGIPGLGLYLVARALGVALEVTPTTLDDVWWRTPVLVLSACANSWAEEVVWVAYLLTRLRQLGWSADRALVATSVLRGAYHLYQGLGGFVGNIAMGLVFGRYWQRTGRLWPLVVAHALIDVVAFVGYSLLPNGWL